MIAASGTMPGPPPSVAIARLRRVTPDELYHDRPAQHDTAEEPDRPRTATQRQAKSEQQRIDQGDTDLTALQAFQCR